MAGMMAGPFQSYGMSLNYVPQTQQIGSQQNIANLAAQEAFLADLLKPAPVAPAPVAPVAPIARELPANYHSSSGGSSSGSGTGGAGRWGPGGWAASKRMGGVNPAFLTPGGGIALGGAQAAAANPRPALQPITSPTSMISNALRPQPTTGFSFAGRTGGSR